MAPEIPVTAHNRVCLGLPPNFNQQLDLHRTFASEITHGSLGDTVDSRRWQEIYIISFQLAGEEGERRRVSGREGTCRKLQCLVQLKRGCEAGIALVPGQQGLSALGLSIWWASE